MYVCYVCKFAVHACDFGAIKKHLSDHLLFGELKYPIHCNQQECCSCFKTINNFMRHYKLYHATVVEPFRSHSGLTENDSSSGESDAECDIQCEPSINEPSLSEPPIEDIRTEALSLCCMLRANSAVPYSIIPDVMSSCNVMLNSVVEHVISSLQSPLIQNMDDVHKFCESLKQLQSPLESLQSDYKQVTAITSNPLFVKPTRLITGLPCIEAVTNGSRTQNVAVYKECQYISVISNLQSLFSSRDFVAAFESESLTEACNTEFITSNVQSAGRYRQHEFYQKSNTVLIQLFYDDMATSNPLRGACAYYNIGVFYYTLRNLPAYFNSCFSNVHLLALCHSMDLKEHGFGIILDKFMSEIHILETQGISVDVAGVGSRHLFGTLFQVTCDNLALNALFSFTKSFTCDFFCVNCYASQTDIQKHFRESQFVLRSKVEHDGDCANASRQNSVVKGVSGTCLLNKSDYFHIIENKTNDCMHTVLEGIVPFELGCILYRLVHEKLILLDTLNRKMSLFYSSLTVEKKNKPLEIVGVHCSGKGISPSMKAVQIWSLLRMLPLVLADIVSQKHPCIRLLHHLCHLTSIIFSPCFTQGMIAYLEDVIEDHLCNFKTIFPDVPLKPKHHFLVHYPSIIRANGPPVTYSCLRYELKNSFFKRSAHIVCNFRNITLTLATRHQFNALLARLSGKGIRDFVFVKNCGNVFLHTLNEGSAICSTLNCTLSDTVLLTEIINYRGKTLKRGSIVIIKDGINCYPLCIFFFVKRESEWKIVGKKAHVTEFIAGATAAVIAFDVPCAVKVLSLVDLFDAEPLDVIKLQGKDVVCLKWHVVCLYPVECTY